MAYNHDPRIVLDFSYQGCVIVWRHTDDADRDRFVAKIKEHGEALRSEYKVKTDFDDEDELRLHLFHRETSTLVTRQQLKGAVFAVICDTQWGGSG